MCVCVYEYACVYVYVCAFHCYLQHDNTTTIVTFQSNKDVDDKPASKQ